MTAESSISCPRCGYDLSGAREANLAAPQPTGTCSECGLGFSWAEIESGRLNAPSFSYEHGRVYAVGRFFRTLGRSITGWRLWGPLAMIHEIKPASLLLFVLLTLVLGHFGAIGADLLALRFGFLGGWGRSGGPWTFSYGASLTPPPPPPGTLFVALSGPVSAGDLIELAVWPYGTQPGAAPFRPGPALSLDLEVIIACGLAQLGTPALLIGLRQTRRKFRLRKVHVLRAVCLGVPFFVALFLIVQLAVQLVGALLSWRGNFLGAGGQATVGAVVFLSIEVLWWWCFCRRYLKAPHALGLACAGAALAALLCMLLGLVLHAGLLWTYLV